MPGRCRIPEQWSGDLDCDVVVHWGEFDQLLALSLGI